MNIGYVFIVIVLLRYGNMKKYLKTFTGRIMHEKFKRIKEVCGDCCIYKDGNRCEEMCSHLECWDESNSKLQRHGLKEK